MKKEKKEKKAAPKKKDALKQTKLNFDKLDDGNFHQTKNYFFLILILMVFVVWVCFFRYET